MSDEGPSCAAFGVRHSEQAARGGIPRGEGSARRGQNGRLALTHKIYLWLACRVIKLPDAGLWQYVRGFGASPPVTRIEHGSGTREDASWHRNFVELEHALMRVGLPCTMGYRARPHCDRIAS